MVGDQLFCQLLPFGSGHEHLKLITFDMSNNSEIVLGRTPETVFENDSIPFFYFLSRRHIKLTVTERKLFVQSIAQQKSLVFINRRSITSQSDVDSMELFHDDVVSLLGNKEYYNYTVTNANNFVLTLIKFLFFSSR